MTIDEVPWHSFQGKVYSNTQDINLQITFTAHIFEIAVTCARGHCKGVAFVLVAESNSDTEM